MPKRRWFQFRLRTLLVGVALIGASCAYISHEYRIVAARKQWLDSHGPISGFADGMAYAEPDDLPKPISIRRFFGDKLHPSILVRDEAELESARELFPEAEVVLLFKPSWGEPGITSH